MTLMNEGASPDRVIPLLREIARGGERAAQYTLSRLPGQDAAEARRWLTLAAGPGRSAAQYQLGNAYLRGVGVRQDSERAVFWLHEAAGRGHLSAQVLLANLLDRGDGAAEDPLAAENWLRTAARRGSAEAQFQLALRLGMPDGEPWLRSAADQGHPGAQRYLGLQLADGGELETDESQARHWLELAAGSGDATAMLLVGLFFEQGRGGSVDLRRAYHWLRRAKDAGEQRAIPFLESVEARLDSELLEALRKGSVVARHFEAPLPKRPVPRVDRALGHGSGFRIGPDLILTSQHVVDTCREVRLPDGRVIEPLAAVPGNDIALFRDHAASPAWLRLASAAGRLGEPVSVLFADGGRVDARLTALERPAFDARFLRFDARLDQGASGTPLLGAEDWVVGLTVAKMAPAAAYAVTGVAGEPAAFALRVELIHAFLDVFDVRVPDKPQGTAADAVVRVECWY